RASSLAYWSNTSDSGIAPHLLKSVLPPFPSVLAMASTPSVLLAVLIAAGFLANAFQVTCNCFIGVTRILTVMHGQGLLPIAFTPGVRDEDDTLYRMHWFYLFLAIPWILAYNLIPEWPNYALGVTFGCGYVFTLTAFATTRVPSLFADEWQRSSLRSLPAK